MSLSKFFSKSLVKAKDFQILLQPSKAVFLEKLINRDSKHSIIVRCFCALTIGSGMLLYVSNNTLKSKSNEGITYTDFGVIGQKLLGFEKIKIFYDLLKPEPLLAKETDSKDLKHCVIITPRQKLFFQFASIEYDGIPYMTPQDFLESVTEDHPRPRIRRKILSKEQYQMFIKNTQSRKYGSNRLFRNLEDRGLISYSEYLFLLCVITKPSSDFEIAFNMFDTDGNQRVDKKEFLVLERIINKELKLNNEEMVTKIFQRDGEPKQLENNLEISKPNGFQIITSKKKKWFESLIVKKDDDYEKTQVNSASDNQEETEPLANLETTLLVHFFGQKGNENLKFNHFKKFMEDLQTEVLEIEFNEFSKGMNKITCIEFAEILLRYTEFNQEKRLRLIKKLQSKIDAYSRDISFDKFLQFSQFMMNLADFQLALKFHTYANRAITREEFQRAVKISSGFKLDPQIVEVIFQVFDENGDGQLSYREFIAVLKGRLNRGLKSKKRHIYEFSTNKKEDLFNNASLNSQSDIFITNDQDETFFRKFKSCIRKRMREKNYE